MKYSMNQTILNLRAKALERAEKNGRGEAILNKAGQEVYRIVVSEYETRLYHYGTLILNIGNYVSAPIINWGGYSSSDRDAMNTLLKVAGSNIRFCIRQRTLQFAN